MVSRSILAAGGLYAVFAALYVLFEKVIINYRPMIMEGDEHVEASFPSTHTMLACVVFGSSILLIRRFVKHDILRMVLQILCGIAILTTVVGRLFCGVHWLTDIKPFWRIWRPFPGFILRQEMSANISDSRVSQSGRRRYTASWKALWMKEF